jgi:hypothetical protein
VKLNVPLPADDSPVQRELIDRAETKGQGCDLARFCFIVSAPEIPTGS